VRLISFQIFECFGFRDSGRIDFSSSTPFFYVLGRNSSGKTCLLSALRHLDLDVKPSDHANFANFNPSDQRPLLRAVFSVSERDLSLDRFLKQVAAQLPSRGLSSIQESHRAQIADRVLNAVREIYETLMKEMRSCGEVSVARTGEGQYSIALDDDWKAQTERRKAVRAALSAIAPGDQVRLPGGKTAGLTLHHLDPEESLFFLFPKIYFFDQEHSLLADLPDRIDEEVLGGKANALLQSLLKLLGRADVERFLRADDPDEREDVLGRLRAQMALLTKEVNAVRRGRSTESLLEFVLHEKNGLQLTVRADGKPSFYRHLSDNTKLLIAYHLYTWEEEVSGSVILFDEPNRGFHPSAEAMLLKFLRSLGSSNTVIVSTHSQYLIDPTLIANIRLMRSGKDRLLAVANSPFRRPKAKGDLLGLQPVFDAIGLLPGQGLELRDQVILVEGVSDLLYLRAFSKLLKVDESLNIAPGRGDTTFLTLIPLLISQGFSFKVVIDRGKIVERIREEFLVPDESMWIVPVPESFGSRFETAGIEDLFAKDDFRRLLDGAGIGVDDSAMVKQPNSRLVASGSKVLLAKTCLELVTDGDLEVSDTTRSAFGSLLEFCLGKENWYRL